VTEVYRLGVKIFAEDSANVRMKDFVGIFHSWIQKQCVEDHQLIDVHDYSHIHNGPGILLVAHEGNFSTDMADGKLGLTYFRKLPAGVTTEDALRGCVKTARAAVNLLEAESVLKGRLRFRRGDVLVIFNDRLLAPNDTVTFEALKPLLSRGFGNAAFTHVSAGTKDRLTIRVKGSPEK
jgi:hypothetical protein